MKKRLLSGFMSFLMVLTLLGQVSMAEVSSDSTQVYVPEVTASASQDEEQEVGKFDEFGMAISALISSQQSETNSGDSVDNTLDVSKFVMVKANKAIDFSEYNPEDVIAGPDNNYYLAFESGEKAESVVKALEKRNDIEYAEQDSVIEGDEIETSDVESSDIEKYDIEEMTESGDEVYRYNSWGVKYTGLDILAQSVETSNSITVAVVDSGVDKNHTSIKSHLTTTQYDYVDSDSSAQDVHGHGTNVAGVIIDATQGLNVNIMPVRVLNEENKGTASWIASGIRYAADHGAKVINLSLGGDHAAAKESAITYAIEKGCTVVVSAGNGSKSIDDSNYCPAHIEDCITVTAIDARGERPSYANYGKTVDVAAPGVGITSYKLGGGTKSCDGTSVAAAHVSAYAAMILLKNPNYTYNQINTHTRIWADDAGAKDFDNYYGNGILNAGDECGYAKVTYKLAEPAADIIDWAERKNPFEYTIPSTIPFRLKYSFNGWEDKNGNKLSPGDTVKVEYGMVFTSKWKGATITIDDEKTYYSAKVDNISTPDGTFYKYTPKASGTYVMQSNGNYDTKMVVYDAEGSELFDDDDSGVSRNFRKEAYLTAGETYYFHVYQYSKYKAEFWFELYKKSLPEYSINYYFQNESEPLTYTTCKYIHPVLIMDKAIYKDVMQTGWAREKAGTIEWKAGDTYQYDVNISLYSVYEDVPSIYSVPYEKTLNVEGYYGYYGARLVAPVTGTYKFSAVTTTGTARYILYNSSKTEIGSVKTTNGSFSYNLVAGQTYYISMQSDHDELMSGTFKIELASGAKGFSTLKSGVANRLSVEKQPAMTYCKFTAPSEGDYCFYSAGSVDVLIGLYNNSALTGEYVYDDDSGIGYNFYQVVHMAANETKYITICGARSGVEGAFDVYVVKSEPINFTTASLAAEDLIGLNVNFKIPECLLADFDAYLYMSYDGQVTAPQKFYFRNAVKTSNGYMFTFPVAIAEIYDKVQISAYGGDGRVIPMVTGVDNIPIPGNTFKYAVSDVLNRMLKIGTAKDKALARAMLDYGSAAGIYFGYNPSATIVANLSGVTASVLAPYKITASGAMPAGLSFSSYSLELESETSLRSDFKFNDSDFDKYTFKCNGVKVTPVRTGVNAYSVKIEGIVSVDLDTTYTISVTDGTKTINIKMSALTYAYNIINKDDKAGKLAKTMYLYSKAADQYFG